MSEITKDNFIEVLKYNGWIKSLTSCSNLDKYDHEDWSIGIYDDDTYAFNALGYKTPYISYHKDDFNNFIKQVQKHVEIKPKIETLEDYIKANFEKMEKHANYIYKEYSIEIVKHVTDIYSDNQFIGTINNDSSMIPLVRKIKILNAFLGIGENEN